MSVVRRRAGAQSGYVLEYFYQFPPGSTYARMAIDTLRANIYVSNSSTRKVERLNLSTLELNRSFVTSPNSFSITGIAYNAHKDEFLYGLDTGSTPIYVANMQGVLLRQFGSVRSIGLTHYHNGRYYSVSLLEGVKVYNETGGLIKTVALSGSTQTRGLFIHEGIVYVGGESETRLHLLNTVEPYPDNATNTGKDLVNSGMVIVTPNGYVVTTDRLTANGPGIRIYSGGTYDLLASFVNEPIFGCSYYNGNIYAVTSTGKLYRLTTEYNL
jgi:hypothetical protein